MLSIKRAHESLTTGRLSYGTVELENANINRSPYAYLANPEEERAKYSSDVDKFMSVLKFTRDSDNKDLGILTWFPVHGTSMYGNNTIVTGDNKGVAASMFEKAVKGLNTAADGFVAGFSQSNVGDTSPNTLGAWCEDGTNVQCSFEFSLCSGVAANCHGRGPNYTIPDRGATSAYTIGTLQYDAARELYDDWPSQTIPITGPTVKSFHTYQNMTGYEFILPNGTKVQTCAAALGYGFAGGTTDWPGSFDFKQGNNGSSGGTSSNPLWKVVSMALRNPSAAQKKCQGTKPILLDVGEMDFPYAWTPNIVDIQVLRVGQLFIIVAPGEATTMSGRRWRAAIQSAAAQNFNLTNSSNNQPLVVLGGPANTYAHYIATEEEYSIQRYEGASTLYGAHTLNAYINLTTHYLPYLSATNTQQPPPLNPGLAPGPTPPDTRNQALSFITPPLHDTGALGTLVVDTPRTARPGSRISATFVAGNPRHDLRLERSYAYVQRLDTDNNNHNWTEYRDDSDWEVMFEWWRVGSVLGTSEAVVTWFVPVGGVERGGSFRLVYRGVGVVLPFFKKQEFEGVGGMVVIV